MRLLWLNLPPLPHLAKLCRKAFGHPPLIVFQLGGVVSANTGPDAIAIVYEGHPRNLEAYAPQLP